MSPEPQKVSFQLVPPPRCLLRAPPQNVHQEPGHGRLSGHPFRPGAPARGRITPVPAPFLPAWRGGPQGTPSPPGMCVVGGDRAASARIKQSALCGLGVRGSGVQARGVKDGDTTCRALWGGLPGRRACPGLWAGPGSLGAAHAASGSRGLEVGWGWGLRPGAGVWAPLGECWMKAGQPLAGPTRRVCCAGCAGKSETGRWLCGAQGPASAGEQGAVWGTHSGGPGLARHPE